jgi:hypothetical protein
MEFTKIIVADELTREVHKTIRRMAENGETSARLDPAYYPRLAVVIGRPNRIAIAIIDVPPDLREVFPRWVYVVPIGLGENPSDLVQEGGNLPQNTTTL